MSPRASANSGDAGRAARSAFMPPSAAGRPACAAPQVTVSSPPSDARTWSRSSPAAANQPGIASSAKPSRIWASRSRSSSRSCGGEIDHQQRAARRQHPRRLGDRRGRLLRIMEHLVDDDAVGALVGERQARTCRPGAGSTAMPAASSLTRARRSISDERSMPIACARARAEQFDHPAGAGADVDQPAERPLAERAVDRALDLAFGDMERADLVPHFGMAGEIAIGGLGAVGADRVGPRRIGSEQGAGRRVGPASISANIGSVALGIGRGSGTPSCLPCAARARRRRRGSSGGAKRAAGSARAPAPVRRPTAPSAAAARGCAAASGRQAPGRSASGSVDGHEIRI